MKYEELIFIHRIKVKGSVGQSRHGEVLEHSAF